MKLSHLAKVSLLLGFSVSSLLHTSVSANTQKQEHQLNEVISAGQQINQSAAKSQVKVNGFTEQVQSKLQQFNTVTKELDGLTVYNQQMNAQINNQVAEISQLAKSIEEVSIIERQISPLMARMISTLEDFVKLDVPFLSQERSKRLNDLNTMMVRADISVSEKFRRVFEAYQVEVDYGRTIEAYSGLLSVEGQEMDVDFLRVGRVSYLYQTRDGSKLGQWDQQSTQWKTLSQDHRLGVNKALRIARKQLAPDLIMVPLTNTQAKL